MQSAAGSLEFSPEQLASYLDRRSTDLLCAQKLYDIGNYGWLDQENIDPAYLGHAMWQTNPPTEVDWDFLFFGTAVGTRPTEKQVLLMVAGNDFEGTMRAARLSLGLCLIHQELALKATLSENHYFWIHQMHTVLLLNMASDRVREYFIAAIFSESADAYKRKGNRNNWFVTPFIEARDAPKNSRTIPSLTALLEKLPKMAGKIYEWREQRNAMTHEISTRLARRQKEVIDRQQQAFDEETEHGKNLPPPRWRRDYFLFSYIHILEFV